METWLPFYMVIRATGRSSCLQGKGSAFICQLFKTLSIGLPSGIECATFPSEVKYSTNWAKPATSTFKATQIWAFAPCYLGYPTCYYKTFWLGSGIIYYNYPNIYMVEFYPWCDCFSAEAKYSIQNIVYHHFGYRGISVPHLWTRCINTDAFLRSFV